MQSKRESRQEIRYAQLPLTLTSLDVVRKEPKRSEVVALLASLLLQAARARSTEGGTDDAS